MSKRPTLTAAGIDKLFFPPLLEASPGPTAEPFLAPRRGPVR